MNWPRATLKALCSFGPQYGANAAAVPRTGERPRYVRITDISSDGVLRADGAVEADLEDNEDFLLKDGDILFARSGNTVGKVYCYSRADGPCVFAGYLIRFRLNTDIIQPRFAFYFTQSGAYRGWIVSKRRVAGQPNVNGSEYSSLTLPLPGLSEQRRIVELLEQADGLRRERAEADTLASRILPAVFRKMFGNPAQNPHQLTRGVLGDVITEASYGTSVQSNTDSRGVAVIRMNSITTAGDLDLSDLKYVELPTAELEKQRLRVGDLLFNRTNTRELVGKTGLWKGGVEAVAASYLIRLRVNQEKALPEFIWAWMNTPFLKQQLFEIARRAAGMANINTTEIRRLPLLLPPKPNQEEFAKRLASLNKNASRRAESRKYLDTLFTVMLYRAFSGELTACWRESHMKELLAEMELQSKAMEVHV